MNKSIKVYGIKNCDTVKKAIVYLNDCGIDFQFIDFRQNPISQQVLKKMVDSVGWELLINKRSTTYRSLSEEEKSNINYDLVLKSSYIDKAPSTEFRVRKLWLVLVNSNMPNLLMEQNRILNLVVTFLLILRFFSNFIHVDSFGFFKKIF